MIDEGRPIFVQIAELIENDIIDGVLQEESQVPSTNEFAAFHRINPATAGKGVNRLVEDGILYKKRGIGMFVAAGARERLVRLRTEDFREKFVAPLLAEAAKLGIKPEQVARMIQPEDGVSATPTPTAISTSTSTSTAPSSPEATVIS